MLIDFKLILLWFIIEFAIVRVEKLMKERSTRANLLAESYLAVTQYLQMTENAISVSILIFL